MLMAQVNEGYMPSKQFDTIWKAEPHTIAKIAILEAYLQAWFQIMGRSMAGSDILYVDGFAGPGEYINFPKGSPVAALNAAKTALESSGHSWKAGNMHCAFIESDAKRFEHLQQVVGQIEASKWIKIHLVQKTFNDGIAQLRSEVPRAFSGASPLFVFIDPFGATGAPFAVVADILKSPRSEVLINFDADGIARIYKAEDRANSAALLDGIFGNHDWESGLAGITDFNALCRQVLHLYKQSLRRLPNVRYTFAFEMRTHAKSLNYYLVFASQHHLGLEKMKEAMKKVDQTGTYQFSDAHVDQRGLFRYDQPENYSPILFAHFQGKAVQYEELRDYALNETPFTNPKSMLKDLEKKELITVVVSEPKRKKGTFPEEKIDRIVFKGGE
jgi:three-Cys-motif partner protein